MKSEEALLARATVLCSILVSCLVIEVAAEDRTWIWNAPGQEAGTSPMTAINWTNAANWVDGILPGASDKAVFGSQSNPPHYVQLMENVVVNRLSSPNQLCIVGPGELQLAGSGSVLDAIVVTYAPIRSLTTSQLNLGSTSASTCYYYSPLYLQPEQICRIDSHSHFGRDKWSDTASETIVNPFPTNVISFYQTRSVYYYAPRGSAEVSGAWTLTSGSPYLTLAGEPHTVAVGAVVCLMMTRMLVRAGFRDWIVLAMPAAVVGAAWSYSQCYCFTMNWFFFAVLAAALARRPRSKFLWCIAVASARAEGTTSTTRASAATTAMCRNS